MLFWVMLLFLCLPLFWIGLLIKDHFHQCPACGMTLGQTARQPGQRFDWADLKWALILGAAAWLIGLVVYVNVSR